jgi:hypothetical protein
MTRNKSWLLPALCGATVVGCATAQPQAPVVDIGDRHGNLREAQELIAQAYQVVDRAQVDNDAHLGGHAARAKELLNQASEELRLAANAANAR